MSITVLIADDNVELTSTLSSYLTKDEVIKVVNIAYDGKSAIESYLKYAPDVLILDLKMPIKNGIQVLDTLCTLNRAEAKKCNIIVISSNLSHFSFKYTSKVYKVFEKPFELTSILDCIYEIYEFTNNKPDCRSICEDAILQLGFNYSSLGTKYLIDIIVYLYENRIDTFSMKDIYIKLSQKTGISIRNIKWNIEKAINSMYRFSKNENLLKVFPNYDGRKPTPKYTISMVLYELNKNTYCNLN